MINVKYELMLHILVTDHYCAGHTSAVVIKSLQQLFPIVCTTL